MIYIVCVLTGNWPAASQQVLDRYPDLGAHYVKCMQAMVDRYAGFDYTFICFTDRKEIEGVECRPIPIGIFSFFGKLYLFSEESGIPDGARVLYFDLDTCLVQDITPLSTVPLDKIVMLRDIWGPKNPASGVMSWIQSAPLRKIWTDFKPWIGKRPPFGPTIRTDEHWLHQYVLPDKWYAWQDLLPGKFLSYKYDVIRTMRRDSSKNEPLTAEAAREACVTYFHGVPRPHAVSAKWNPIYVGI